MNSARGNDKTVILGAPLQHPAGIAIPNPGGRIKSDEQSNLNQAQDQFIAEGLIVDTKSTAGKNIVVNCATTLLAVLAGLRNAFTTINVLKLQEDLIAEIKSYDINLRNAGVKEEEAQVARYIICTAIDEAILSTPWGADSGWSQRSLLRIFHRETSGGEKFFALLNGVKTRPGEFRDVLELFYVLLTFGFKGRFQVDPHGNEKLEHIREDLFTHLYASQSFIRTLSPHWKSDVPRDPKMLQVIPLWALLSIIFAICISIFTGLRVLLHNDTADIAARFESIATDDTN